ncbi:MAG: hypothetical protein ACTSYR_04890 [Candidatus Odinarchaeia archaeon]
MKIKNQKKIVIPLMIITPLLLSLVYTPFIFTNVNAQPTGTEELNIKPIGIVYSNLSIFMKQQVYDSYNSNVPVILPFYTIESFTYMSGLKFEVIPEDNVTNVAVLQNYSCIIIPENQHMYSVNRSTITNIYRQYLENGGNIIGFGSIGFKNESDQLYSNYDLVLESLFNVKYNGFIASDEYTNYYVESIDSPITMDYQNRTIFGNFTYFDDEVIGVDLFTVNDSSIRTFSFLNIRNMTTDETITQWGFASEIGSGRSVYFYIYDLGTTKWINQLTIILRAIQWCVFRNNPPVGLQMTPGRLIWMLTIDQDWAFVTENTTSALRKLIDLADKYHFTFGWAIIAQGPVDLNDTPYGYINWTACKPLFLEAYSKGHDLASHSVTHIYWDQVAVTEQRALNELNLSKIYLEGNLSLPIDGLQVWGPGVWYGRYNASKFIVYSGYKYVTELYIDDFPYMMGKEFYFSNTSSVDFNIKLPVFFRQSLSDHNYFYTYGYTAQEAWNIEKEHYDKLYNIGHGMPYIFLWHDYSIDNDSRLPLLMNMLNYELWNKTDIYPCSPYELYHRLEAHDSINYNVTYSENSITLNFDLTQVPSEFQDYIAGLTFTIDNTSKAITQVLLDGQPYYAFSENKIILPELSGTTHTLSITLGDASPQYTRITHLTAGSLLNMNSDSGRFSFTIKPLKQKVGRVFLNTAGQTVVVFVNGSYYSDWVGNNSNLVLNLTLNGETQVDVFTVLKLDSTVKLNKYSYTPGELLYLTFNLNNSYPYEFSVNITLRLTADTGLIDERTITLTAKTSEIATTQLTFTLPETSNLRLNLEIIINSAGKQLSSTTIQNLTQIYWFQSDLLLSSLALIAVFSVIIIYSNRYIDSKKLTKTGEALTNGLLGFSPILFILGVFLFVEYHYSQMLTLTDIESLSLIFAIGVPVTFSFYGFQLLSKRSIKNAVLSEDIGIIKTSLNNIIKITSYGSIGVFIVLLIASITTGIISFNTSLLISLFSIPNIYLISLIGVYLGLNKKLIVTGVFLLFSMTGVISSLYITYYMGLIGLISVIGGLIALCDVVLYIYLVKKFLTPSSIIIPEQLYYEKRFIEENKDLKILFSGLLLINVFLLVHYLIYFLTSTTVSGLTLMMNASYQLPVLIIQLTLFPAICASGLLINTLREQVNKNNKLLLKKREIPPESINKIKKTLTKGLTVSFVTVLIIGLPIIFFLGEILAIFQISSILTLLEEIILLVNFGIFASMWFAISILIEFKPGYALKTLIIFLILAVVLPTVLFYVNFFDIFLNILIGLLVASSISMIISIMKVNSII